MDASPDPYGSSLFVMEAHLRDYLATNPRTFPGQADLACGLGTHRDFVFKTRAAFSGNR